MHPDCPHDCECSSPDECLFAAPPGRLGAVLAWVVAHIVRP
jgi:hypothetical protein